MSTVISIHTLHDANVSICKDGKLLAVLELESKLIILSKSEFSQGMCERYNVIIYTGNWTCLLGCAKNDEWY